MKRKHASKIDLNTQDIELLIRRYCQQQRQIDCLDNKIDRLIALLVDIQLNQKKTPCVVEKTYRAD